MLSLIFGECLDYSWNYTLGNIYIVLELTATFNLFSIKLKYFFWVSDRMPPIIDNQIMLIIDALFTDNLVFAPQLNIQMTWNP